MCQHWKAVTEEIASPRPQKMNLHSCSFYRPQNEQDFSHGIGLAPSWCNLASQSRSNDPVCAHREHAFSQNKLIIHQNGARPTEFPNLQDRIKGSNSRFPSRKLDQGQQITRVARSSASRSWVGYIMTIAEVHKLFQRGRCDCLRHGNT